MSRNMIDYNTGVVKTYALGTEEHLPSETYLFSYLEDDGKTVDCSQTAFSWITQKITSCGVIRLGETKTSGKGLLSRHLKLCRGLKIANSSHFNP